ncbi:SRPBCC family protein [Chitinilyticum piscinae]|nr:SRPBCC family protein [Chitinilyticum piscinae]
MFRYFCCIAIFLLATPLWADDAVMVQAESKQGHILVTAEFTTPVPQALVFAVLTDFDHMSEYVPSLKHSRILSTGTHELRVEQKGAVNLGLFSLDFDSQRAIELHGMDEILSHSLDQSQGKYSSSTQLMTRGDVTRVVFRSDWEPNQSLLAEVGTRVIRDQISQQFSAMQKEMLRRSSKLTSRTGALDANLH